MFILGLLVLRERSSGTLDRQLCHPSRQIFFHSFSTASKAASNFSKVYFSIPTLHTPRYIYARIDTSTAPGGQTVAETPMHVFARCVSPVIHMPRVMATDAYCLTVIGQTLSPSVEPRPPVAPTDNRELFCISRAFLLELPEVPQRRTCDPGMVVAHRGALRRIRCEKG